MTNIRHREKFNRLNSQIWKRTKIDSQGRVTLPQKLRRKLEINNKSSILWICANKNKSRDNEFLIEIGVKR